MSTCETHSTCDHEYAAKHWFERCKQAETVLALMLMQTTGRFQVAQAELVAFDINAVQLTRSWNTAGDITEYRVRVGDAEGGRPWAALPTDMGD